MSKTTITHVASGNVAPRNGSPPIPPITEQGTTFSEEWYGEGRFMTITYEVPTVRDSLNARRIIRSTLSLN